MPINLQTEQLISLVQAARELPCLRNNRPVAPPTIWRWTRYGVRAGGRVILLEVSSIAGRTVTSREAVQRFLAECAAARSGRAIPETVQPTGRGHEAACRALDAAGI